MDFKHSRAHIRLMAMKDIDAFISALNQDGTPDRYTLENFSGSLRINARSLNGVIYAAMDFNDELFLVNETRDGVYPNSINEFRA